MEAEITTQSTDTVTTWTVPKRISLHPQALETSAIYCRPVLEKVGEKIPSADADTAKVEQSEVKLCSWRSSACYGRLCTQEFMAVGTDHRDLSRLQRIDSTCLSQDSNNRAGMTHHQACAGGGLTQFLISEFGNSGFTPILTTHSMKHTSTT